MRLMSWWKSVVSSSGLILTMTLLVLLGPACSTAPESEKTQGDAGATQLNSRPRAAFSEISHFEVGAFPDLVATADLVFIWMRCRRSGG
jgi:hypothetical protein